MRFFTTLQFVWIFLVALTSLTGQINPPEMLPAAFNQPVDIKHAGDERLFIVEKTGRIWIMDKQGNKAASPFLDITDRVNAGANERGLLGLAFHPDFASNGYFYVNYTGAGGHTRISRFQLAAGMTEKADSTSEMVLLQVNQPFNNHNAGDLAFGPDGYLYIPLGDGGNAGDPGNRSQNPMEMLGKMLRIDVNSGMPYGIPADNPFVSAVDTLPEIWSLGLRNPWRISFDRLTGDLWIADVGQGEWEEINLEPAGSSGGFNWGWRCYEGFAPYNTAGCGPQNSYVPPIHVYANIPSVGCSVTGGYVYRGKQFPSMSGKYFFTDFCSGRIWTLESDGNGGWTATEVYKGPTQEYVSFGEDNEGELYLAAIGDGRIFRITAPCALTALPTPLAPSCAGQCDGGVTFTADGGCPPYQLVLEWADSSFLETSDLFADSLCPGIYNYTLTDCQGCVVEGSFEITQPAPLVLTTMTTPASCPGECDGELVVLASGGCPPYIYEVTAAGFSDSLSVYNSLCAGDYLITVRDCQGCETSTEAVITEPAVYSVSLFWNGDTLKASSGLQLYRWFRNDSLVAETTTGEWLPDSSGIWRVEGLDPNGCPVVSNEVEVILSATEETWQAEAKVYPVPFNDFLRIEFPSLAESSFELRDALGRTVRRSKTRNIHDGPVEWSTSDLPDGVYILLEKGRDGYSGSRCLVKSSKGL